MASSIEQGLVPYHQQNDGPWKDYNLGTLVSYAALLTSLEAKREAYELAEIWESNTTPAQWLTLQIVERLSDHHLIKLDPHPIASNCKATLQHKNDDQHLRSILKEVHSREVNYLDKSLLSITHSYLKANLHAHISKQLNKVGINLRLEEGDFETLAGALDRHSLSEIYMVIWQATQNLSPSNLRFFSLSEDSKGITQQIEDAFLEILGRYESKNRAIKPFQFSQKTRSSLSLVLFNSVLGINDNYYKKSFRQIWNYYA